MNIDPAYGVDATSAAPAPTACAPAGPSSSGSASARRRTRRPRAAPRAPTARPAGRGRRRSPRGPRPTRSLGPRRRLRARRARLAARSAGPRGRGRRLRCRSPAPASSASRPSCPPRPRAARRPSVCRPRRRRRRRPTGAPASASTASTAGPGTGSRPCSVRTVPCPTAIGGAAHLRDAEVVQGRAGADDVGQRVQRTDLVEVHLLGVDAVRGALGPRQAREHVQRAVPDRSGRVPAPSIRARTSGQVRRTSLAGAATSTLVAASPARVT